MKIRTKIAINSIPCGAIVDAAVNSDFSMAVVFDANNIATWFNIGQFEVVAESTVGHTPSNPPSIRDLLGQDIKSIELK